MSTHAQRAAEYFGTAELAAENKDWGLAEESISAGLLEDPETDPARYFQLGTAREGLGEHQGAIEAYREAIRRHPEPPGHWRVRVGAMFAAQKRPRRAVEAYRAAIAGSRDQASPAWCLELGSTLEKLGRPEEARQAYQRGLEVDPHATEVEQAMLRTDPTEFPARLEHARFVARHLDRIREDADAPLEPAEDRTDVFYWYWAQGYDEASEVVHLCHRKLLELSSTPVLTLDASSMAELISLPPDIDSRPHVKHAHRAGLLRLELLARHGGTWIDADCLVSTDPAVELRKLRETGGLFAYDKRGVTLRNWVLSSVPGHYIIRMQRAALHLYWRLHFRPLNYLAFHYVFESLTHLDEGFAQAWAATPRLTYAGAGLHRNLHAHPVDDATYQETLASSFVHKLSYKQVPKGVVDDSVLGRLLAEHRAVRA